MAPIRNGICISGASLGAMPLHGEIENQVQICNLVDDIAIDFEQQHVSSSPGINLVALPKHGK